MSGGAFDYIQCHPDLEDVPTVIASAVNYRIELGYPFSAETIKEFDKCIEAVRVAMIYLQRVDWLISGDDGEKEFHERLKEELGHDEDGGILQRK